MSPRVRSRRLSLVSDTALSLVLAFAAGVLLGKNQFEASAGLLLVLLWGRAVPRWGFGRLR